MPFWQIWQKIKTAAILAWFGRNGSNLKIKLLYKRALDIVYFRHYMYFAIAIIRLSKMTLLGKKWQVWDPVSWKIFVWQIWIFGDNIP